MHKATRVLIVEDTVSLALGYAAHLERAGCEVQLAHTGAAARTFLADAEGAPWDVVLLDLQLPDCDGLELLGALPGLPARSSVIVVTTDGSINRAIAAMRLGAFDFLVKPLAPARLVAACRGGADRVRLAREVKPGRRHDDRDRFHGFVGSSPPMQTVYRAIQNVADSRATVFVTGESGTGKELAAEAIHRQSVRRDRPFVAINCGAIPENLLESELFGHLRGAFTGATEQRVGAAKLADGGTLFLDEICEMELKLQVKLLRFLQAGTIQRVGSNAAEPVDVRVVCATNRDPAREVALGRFREDLFYRLAVIPLELPPLRARGDDVQLIATAFLERFRSEEGRALQGFSPAAAALLSEHGWPGNVRELQNAVCRAVVLGRSAVVQPDDLGILPTAAGGGSSAAPAPRPVANDPSWTDALDGLSLDTVERLTIEAAIARANGSVTGAAQALQVSPSTLYRKRERWANCRVV